MLTCLVGIVGAALFGTALPDLLNGLLDGRWPATKEKANQLASEAPPFNSPSSNEWEARPTDGPQNPPVWPDQSRQSPPIPLTSAPGLPVGQPAPRVHPGAQPDRRSTSHEMPPITPPRDIPPIGAVQASYESWAPQPSDSRATSHEPHPGEALPPPSTQSAQDVFQPDRPSRVAPGPQTRQPVDRFTYIQTRLRELGAAYYRLENWGSQGQYFRFHCRMAIGRGQEFTRQFEATESDALQAMAQVLEEVELWRGSR